MKTDLQQLIETAKLLCEKLEQAAKEEQEFCKDLENEFEVMSWQVFRMTEELRLIREYKENVG